MATGDHALVKRLKTDPINAPLGPQDKSMINFALKVTREPHSVKPEDIQELNHRGFSEEQVVDIVLITCLFNFMDRLADGLGVELAPEMQRLVEKNAGLG
ncbi:MAG: carboxymuconolactone decarboxylase family protein [Candidatus Dormibacteria bacterium]